MEVTLVSLAVTKGWGGRGRCRMRCIDVIFIEFALHNILLLYQVKIQE